MASDGVVRALLPGELLASVTVVTLAAREARQRHNLARASASVLAQGLAGGVLLASLQKERTRINLQLECDGPLGGFFVDASPEGDCRGYVKNPSLDVELGKGAFRWRAALGNSGFLSALRDIGEEYYRSSVELTHLDVAKDLEHYFAVSDQVPTRLALTVRREGEEGLFVVAGALVQTLPGTEPALLDAAAADLDARLERAVEKAEDPASLCAALFPDGTVTASTPVQFRCTCSRARVLGTLAAMGPAELQDIIDTTGSTAVSCHLCATRYEVTLPDLLGLLEQVQGPRN